MGAQGEEPVVPDRQASKGEDEEEDEVRRVCTFCGFGWGWGGLGSRVTSFSSLSPLSLLPHAVFFTALRDNLHAIKGTWTHSLVCNHSQTSAATVHSRPVRSPTKVPWCPAPGGPSRPQLPAFWTADSAQTPPLPPGGSLAGSPACFVLGCRRTKPPGLPCLCTRFPGSGTGTVGQTRRAAHPLSKAPSDSPVAGGTEGRWGGLAGHNGPGREVCTCGFGGESLASRRSPPPSPRPERAAGLGCRGRGVADPGPGLGPPQPGPGARCGARAPLAVRPERASRRSPARSVLPFARPSRRPGCPSAATDPPAAAR